MVALAIGLLLMLLSWTASTAVYEGDLRLVGSSLQSGRLEVYIRGEWGTVCDNGFGEFEARVACGQMGYTSSSNVRKFGNVMDFRLTPADPSTRIWLDNVDCVSVFPTHLLACGHSGAGVVACTHTHDVALECSGTSSSSERSSPDRAGEVRLIGSSTGDIGRLEIYLDGKWGTVCGRDFGQQEAEVACRQLGFSSATKFGQRGSDLGTFLASGPSVVRWLDVTECGPSDQTLLSCAHRSAGFAFHCGNFKDISLECASTRREGELRLVGANFASRRLEIYLRGEWGTVCSHGFGTAEAEVACKQLGYSSVSRLGASSSIGAPPFSPNPPVNIWLSNVDCGCGDEELLSCGHSSIGESVADCTHSDDVALVCSNRTPDESAVSCSDGVAVIAAAVIFPTSIILLLLVISLALAHSQYRKKWTSRHGRPSNSTPDGMLQGHTLQSQQAPPTQPFQEQLLPNSTLHKAPPPEYEQGVNYPSPSSPEAPPPPYQSYEASCPLKSDDQDTALPTEPPCSLEH